jgi:hypothetical protein
LEAEVMTKEQKTCRGHMSELHRLACPICNPEKSTCTTPLPTDTTQDTGRVKTTPEALTSNEQVYRDALVAIRDRLQLRRKSHEDTQRDNDYAYQNANEALFATGAGFARVSDETACRHDWVCLVGGIRCTQCGEQIAAREVETAESRDYAAVRDAHDKTTLELGRYKKALYTANGFLIQLGREPVKLDYSSVETTAPPVSAPEKACDHYWHTDGYCVKCEMPQQKASGEQK